MKSVIDTVKTFYGEVRQEAHKVSWPTWQETKQSTLLVVVFSASVAVLLGLFDLFFRGIMSKFFI